MKIRGIVAVECKIPLAIRQSNERNRGVAHAIHLDIQVGKVCFLRLGKDETTDRVVANAPVKDTFAPALCAPTATLKGAPPQNALKVNAPSVFSPIISARISPITKIIVFPLLLFIRHFYCIIFFSFLQSLCKRFFTARQKKTEATLPPFFFL
jgi:hypothetical protein